jgi:2-hydroxychromene-2-carboxylate isomerase
MMAAPIHFYFDFSSPYGFLAAQRIDALAAQYGRTAAWRPVLLGAIFKETGAAPLTQVPLKGEYSRRDMLRSARFHGIEDFRLPSRFPIPTQAAARIVLALQATDEALATNVAKALYRAYFVDDRDISDPDIAAGVAGKAGADATAMRRTIDDPKIKEALRDAVADAMKAGVCGSPFFIVDGEPFWGLDRFPQLERWLATGGF